MSYKEDPCYSLVIANPCYFNFILQLLISRQGQCPINHYVKCYINMSLELLHVMVTI